MAKAKTDDPAFDAEEVTKLFKKSKMGGEPFAFAFGLASKPEDCGFAVHLRRPGKALKKELKASSKAIGKVCFGTFTVVENDVRLASPKPIQGIIKQLRIRFRKAGLGKYKPMLVGPDGQEIDEATLPSADQFDDTDDDTPTTGDVPPPAPPPPPTPAADPAADPGDAKVLAARLAGIRGAIAKVPGDAGEKLGQRYQRAVGLLKAGDLAGATTDADTIEKALARLSPAPPPPPETPQNAFRQLVANLGALSEDKRKPLMPRVQQIKTAVAEGRGDDALRAIAELREAIEGPDSGTAASASPQELLEAWNSAKEDADADIDKLATALRKFGEPALDRVADHGITGLNDSSVYTKLTAALLDHARAPAERQAMTAEKLVPAVAAYREALLTDRMVAHWEDNPLGITVNIRGRLGRTLDRIEKEAQALL